MALTDTAIRNAKPKAKAYKLADDKGLYLLVSPGGGKWWRLKYRVGGREKSLSFGVYPEVPLKEAREKRDAARKLLRDGIDPSAARKAKAEAAKVETGKETTFAEVAADWHQRNTPGWSAHYAGQVLGRLANVLPDIGETPIASVTRDDLLASIRKIEARKSYDQAYRVLRICGSVFQHALLTGKIAADPAAGLHKVLTRHVAGKMPAVKMEELPALWHAIKHHVGEEQTKIGLMLLAHLFVRPGTLAHAEWSEVSFKDKLWTIPEAKMKKRREFWVPLSPEALALFHRLHELNGWSQWCFPGRTSALKPVSKDTFRMALVRAGYRGRMSAHGFRAVAKSTLTELRSLGKHKFSRECVRIQMSWKHRDKLDEAYDRAELIGERRRLMGYWSAYLTKLPKPASGK